MNYPITEKNMGTDKKTKESNEGPGALDNATFEEAAAELQTIVDKLNSGSAQLDEMIALYERGVALANHCTALLKEYDGRIEKAAAKTRPAE